MTEAYQRGPDEQVSWGKSIPFILMHVMAGIAFFVDFGWREVLAAVALYYVRMFFITAGYHRYFAHRGYKLGRVMQFLMALGGTTAAQKGPLWWAGHHRHHHRYSDLPEDIHSPKKGFVWSHVGWIVSEKYDETPTAQIKDFAKYPELRWLNKFHLIPPTILGVTCWLVGGVPMLFWGFFLSTVVLYHGTFTINSLSHVFGRRRYVTTDTSRNSLLLALITCGEGWHNNHHYFQSTANQGFFWWEVDASYYVIRLMGLLGLAHDIRTPPAHVLVRDLVADGHHDVGLLGELPDRARKVAAGAAAAASAAAEKVKEAASNVAEGAMPSAHGLHPSE